MRMLWRAVTLPAILSRHHSVFAVLLLIGIFNGLVNMILSSLGSVYQAAYHFSARTAGLAYLGIGIGGLSSLAVSKKMKRAVTTVSASLRFSEAEVSLLFLGSILPISVLGLLWYGWAVQKQVFWIIPIFGLFFFGFGWMATRVCHIVNPHRTNSITDIQNSFPHNSILSRLFQTIRPRLWPPTLLPPRWEELQYPWQYLLCTIRLGTDGATQVLP